MEKRDWWNDEMESKWKNESKKKVMETFVKAEAKMKPRIELLFEDVYDEMPENLKAQYNELIEHLKNYKEHYPVKNFDNLEKML